jgi:hypothetical protein
MILLLALTILSLIIPESIRQVIDVGLKQSNISYLINAALWSAQTESWLFKLEELSSKAPIPSCLPGVAPITSFTERDLKSKRFSAIYIPCIG